MKYGVIYLITNIINKKIYIGQTISDINIRFRSHANRRSGMLIGDAIRKYGRDSFTIEEIYTAFTKDSLNEAEKVLIKTFNCLAPNGYNKEYGGRGNKTVEEYKKMTDRLRKWRKENPPEKGRKVTEETKKKMSKSQKSIGHFFIFFYRDRKSVV